MINPLMHGGKKRVTKLTAAGLLNHHALKLKC